MAKEETLRTCHVERDGSDIILKIAAIDRPLSIAEASNLCASLLRIIPGVPDSVKASWDLRGAPTNLRYGKAPYYSDGNSEIKEDRFALWYDLGDQKRLEVFAAGIHEIQAYLVKQWGIKDRPLVTPGVAAYYRRIAETKKLETQVRSGCHKLGLDFEKTWFRIQKDERKARRVK